MLSDMDDDETIVLQGSDMDCGPRCSSRQHAAQLITAVTKATSPRQASLFLSRCHNPGLVRDAFGRTVLHIAASCGIDQSVIAALVKRGSDQTTRDKESGWTALHRALFYGQLSAARLLITLGGDVTCRDYEGLTPLDIVMKDRLPHVEFLHSGLSEVFTWGDNANSTLGHENVQRKFRVPEPIGTFIKLGVSIRQVALSKYHTVLLSDAGKVYTCGHGLGGRLGHGDELPCVVPRFVESLQSEVCAQVSAGHDHSLFFVESGAIYSCGLNTYSQLGQSPPPDKCLAPKPVNAKILRGCRVVGVHAQRFHSVVYTDDTVYTFGLNAGQISHVKGEPVITQPRPVSVLAQKDTIIKQVAASDGATVVLTSRGDVVALHRYQCRKIVSKWLDIVQVSVIGGHLDPGLGDVGAELLTSSGGAALTVLLVTSTGKAYLWRDTDRVIRRCAFVAPGRALFVVNSALSVDSLAVVTRDGEAFTGRLPLPGQTELVAPLGHDVAAASSDLFIARLSDLVERDDVLEVSLDRVPYVHRATTIYADRKGSNLAVLQAHPNACVTSIPSVRNSDHRRQLETLLSTAALSDLVHDIVLQVRNEKIPAHRYILAERSEFFRSRVHETQKNSDADDSPEIPTIVIDLVAGGNVTTFFHILTFLYTDSCDLLTVGRRIALPVANGSVLVDKSNSKGSQKNKPRPARGSATKKSENHRHGNVSSESQNGVVDDPIVSLRTMARQFDLKTLVKRLDCVQYVDGIVQLVPGRQLPVPRVYLARRHQNALQDVDIEVDDGIIVSCHKCVLDARLDYFHGLFSSTWIETSSTHHRKSKVKLPISAEVLDILLDFLYTDNSHQLSESSTRLELLCSVLAVADQLLVGRLKDLCEVAIAQQLNLRNVCELLEFSDACNASQLKETCHQFVCINLAALLETRSLDPLCDDTMADLTKYYRDTIYGMSRRHITPYSGYPDRETLESLEREYIQRNGAACLVMPGARKGGKTRRKRTKSTTPLGDMIDSSLITSSPLSAGLTLPSPLFPADEMRASVSEVDVIEEIDCEADLLKSSSSTAASRPLLITAVKPAAGMIQPTLPAAGPCWAGQAASPPLTKIVGFVPQSPTGKSPTPNTAATSVTLRDILAAESAVGMATDHTKLLTPTAKSVAKAKKLSQSDRKRLAAQTSRSADLTAPSGSECGDQVAQSPPASVPTPPANPWGSVNTVIKSFKDLMLSDEKSVQQRKPDPRPEVKVVQSKPGVAGPVTISPSVRATNASSLHSPPSDTVIRWGLFSTSETKLAVAAPTPAVPHSPEPTSPSTEKAAWKLVSCRGDTVASPASVGMATLTSTASFVDIVRDEITQDATLYRTTNKSLALIQIEERAIASLLECYTTTDNVHEYVTVQRVSTSERCARPLWAATQRQTLF